jgi:hypothetical protein
MTGKTIRTWTVDDKLFEEYCHVVTHLSLKEQIEELEAIEGEEECGLGGLSLGDLDMEKVKLHNKILQNAGFKGFHGRDSEVKEYGAFNSGLLRAAMQTRDPLIVRAVLRGALPPGAVRAKGGL